MPQLGDRAPGVGDRANRFASEKFEAGNANMEYDAALDAMTIDADHENELGMEGVDMYQNQLAKLSGSLDSMNTAGGIDFDGDGQVDVSAEKPGALMKYSEFVAPGLQVATGISMGPSGDPACDLPDYAPEANGIIPGYAGHIPRARDKYGGSAHLGCSMSDHGVHVHMGPQIGHVKQEALGNKYGTDGLPLRGGEIQPRFDNYQQKVQGVMPGYGGFRPGARDECGFATVGGIKRFGVGQNRGAHEAPKPDFVPQVRGVLPGYTGYVPSAKNTHGVSHYGSLAGGHHNMPAAGPQKGHGNAVKGDKLILAKPHVMAGYSGHVPAARDTFGGSHYGVGSHLSPDDYELENRLAGTGTKMSDFRLIAGSDAGNSDYARDDDGGTGGKFFGQAIHNAGDHYHNHAQDDEPPPSQVAGRNMGAAMAFSGIDKKQGMLSY
jgi:hypothetical protein